MPKTSRDLLAPKADVLEKADQGQAFNHELPLRRDWETALDAIHFMLLRKWYYVGIATNTKKGVFGSVVKKGMIIERKRKNLPEELKIILKMKISTFDDLKSKIRQKQISDGGNKDVWHFKTKWKEFPKGSKIIQLHQQLLKSFITGSNNYRKAFIVMDGKCSPTDQNVTMMIIKRIFENKKYTHKIIKEISHLKEEDSLKKEGPSKVEPKLRQSTGKIDLVKTRLPGSLVVELRDNKAAIKTLKPKERELLLDYLAKLKTKGEFSSIHESIENQIRTHFKC